MIAIAIVDDDPLFARKLAGQISTYAGWGAEKPDVKIWSSAEEFYPLFEKEAYDLIILDVIMPGPSGLEMARHIYDRSPGTYLAFTSSSPDHARSGYGVDALAYLLKPVADENVHRLLDEVLARRARRAGQHMILKTGRNINLIRPADLLYLESANKKVFFHYPHGDTAYAGKLDDFLSQLPPNFVRIHKSYAVNLDHIEAMRPGEMLTDDGRSIPISRRFRPQAEKLYLAHVADKV